MDTQILYGNLYTDNTNGDQMITIYEGIHLPNTPINTRVYPVVRHFGNLNITQRYFLKGRKFPRKIVTMNEATILLDNQELRIVQAILTDLGHPQEFINLVISTISNSSLNQNVGTYERWKSICHRFDFNINDDSFPSDLTGKISF